MWKLILTHPDFMVSSSNSDTCLHTQTKMKQNSFWGNKGYVGEAIVYTLYPNGVSAEDGTLEHSVDLAHEMGGYS
jgi:hypothetical protein